jgi:hypothetical protein
MSIKLKNVLKILFVLSLLTIPVMAADLQKPSALRGWANFPADVQGWVQTIMDWGMAVVVILAVTIILMYFIIGKGADHSGGVQQKNISTQKIIFTFLELILLAVVISLIWAYFWTPAAVVV